MSVGIAPSPGGIFLLNVASDHIYFDGLLPPQKQAIRMSRLGGNLKELVTFHSIHSHGLKALPDPPKPLVIEAGHVLDSSRPVPSAFKGLPAAPFLVPAVIEALTSSPDYATAVQIVPAEADCYCAAAARENAGVILTSDSDLLVHDIGPNGAVAFFNQFGLQRSAAGCTSIHVCICRPGEIAKRLALDDLRRLAFEIKKDPSASFQEALRKTRRYKPMGITDIHYEEFLEEYAAKALDVGHSSMSVPTSPLANPYEQCLDPRVSEVILHFTTQSDPQVKMYLPFLIDDPSRSPAWDVSSSVRCLAYSLLLFLPTGTSKVRSVAEYGRRGHRIASEEVHLLTEQQCLIYVEGLQESIDPLGDRLSDIAHHNLVKAYAIYMVCQWYVDNDKSSPSRGTLSRLITGSACRTLAWTDIHLSAQLQAALYSLRMLKQILRYVKEVVGVNISPLRTDLERMLESLGPLERLIPSRVELIEEQRSMSETEGLINAVFSLLGDGGAEEHQVDEDNPEGSSTSEPVPSDFTEIPNKRRKKARVAQSKAVPSVSNEPPKRPNNIYRLLAES